ncbi:hypothetical protein [Zunongwangia sp. H14]|uniref:hypothetical protein n=1 Tax=Zunongwangia sp. H14 TaxID=3240792 RepID=UPI00356A72C7
MISNIQEHHNEEEIQKMTMEGDAWLWREELEFYLKEIDFYLLLISSGVIRETGSNKDINYLLKKFQKIKESNELYLETCIQYQCKLPQVKECDDVQCDNAFLKSHILFKNKLEEHFQEIRNIKQSAFMLLKDSIEEAKIKR